MQDQDVMNHLKALVIDGVHHAASGHPGGALSSMDIAYLLFSEFIRFHPDDPQWVDRDRFILSAGHESMLLYSLLFARGWLEKKDLMAFRQYGSKTPGHPENLHTPGVECTTGPLGQGAAMSVGFAVAEKHLSATLGTEIIHHKTWALLGDGCMQEDVTLGAASLAGHWGLSQLIWIYDQNSQQISGPIARATSNHNERIFQGLQWEVRVIDGHNHGALKEVFHEAAHGIRSKPLLIIAHTVMAKGAGHLEGDHTTHGAPLSPEDRQHTKERLLGHSGESFCWPHAAQERFDRLRTQRLAEYHQWQQRRDLALSTNPKRTWLWDQYFPTHPAQRPLPQGILWDTSKPLATRQAFGKLLAHYGAAMPQWIGGSADLEPSNMTHWFAQAVQEFTQAHPLGRNLSFGVREFPMAAIANGIALHGGLIPFTATFLVFSDYARPALRLGAIQKATVIHEFTHDSFYVGEDGPTHQPVEHLMSLRLIPDLYLMRPADGFETEALFCKAMTLPGPSCFSLTRQALPWLPRSQEAAPHILQGAWMVRRPAQLDPQGGCLAVFFATGSEVHLALEVCNLWSEVMPSMADKLAVVSIPCWELFWQSPKAYQDSILMRHCGVRIAIEAGSSLGWERFVGSDGLIIGMDTFGASGKAGDLEKAFGFTKQQVFAKIQSYFKHI